MKRLLYVVPFVLALGLTSTFPALAAGQAGRSNVPHELRVPNGYKRVLRSVGRGVQIYDCVEAAWKFREPRATIFDKRARSVVAIHFAGPTWESLQDGSMVVGAVKARHDAPNPERDIPWLLLQATGNAGPGVFAEIDYIQRLDTVGGVAPAGPCATGDTAEVPYQATYDFWAPAK